jgi:hypothetical protein
MTDDAAKIPTTEREFALWMMNLRVDLQSDPNLSEQTRADLEEHFNLLNGSIVRLMQLHAKEQLQTAAEETLQAIAEALHAAMRLGAYHSDAPRSPPTGAGIRKRMRATYAGRRRDDIQRIVERLAQELWNKNKKFVGNAEATAENIFRDVLQEVANLNKVPKQWRIGLSQSEVERQRAIDRIAARIRRFMSAEECHSQANE